MDQEVQLIARKPTFFILISAFIFYLFVAIHSMQEFSIQDEILIENSVASININGNPEPQELGFQYPAGSIAGSIPSYYYILSFLSRFFGTSKVMFNVFGIFCTVITLIILYFISKEVSRGYENAALLSCLLFITHPMVIQGSLLVEIDNTILLLFSNLFILIYLKLEKIADGRRLFLLGILFSILLCLKISTPLALPLAILIFNMLQNKFKKGIYQSVIIFSIGFSVFIIVWLAYHYLTGYPWLVLFSHTLRSAVRFPLNAPLVLGPFITIAGVKEILRLFLWTGPFFIILCILAIAVLIKDFIKTRQLSSLGFLAIYALLVWGVYTFIKGTAYSFPRYYLPAMPALIVCLADFVIRSVGRIDKRSIILYSILAILSAIFYYFVVGDLLYIINFLLKKTAIFTPLNINSVLKKIIFMLILYIIPAFFTFLIIKFNRKKDNILKLSVLTMLILVFSTNLSLDCLQAKADYNTTYDYGETKKAPIINFLRAKLSPTDVILAPIDIPYYLKNKNFIFFDYRIIGTTDSFIKTINEKKVTCVVYGTNSFNLAYYLKVVMANDAQDYLRTHFKQISISSYTIWLRY